MRTAHHRADYRTGPHHNWLRRKSYHLNRLYRALRAALELIVGLRPVGPGLYRLERPFLMSRARQALDDVRHYLEDESGDVWN